MRLALIQFLDGGPSASNELPGMIGGSIGRPDNSLPSGPPGSIGTLPVFPFDPTKPVDPGYGQGGGALPDNSLPNAPVRPSQPIQLHPGLRLVVKWIACYGFVGVPDNSLPETPEPK